jgi:hypothetical protein
MASGVAGNICFAWLADFDGFHISKARCGAPGHVSEDGESEVERHGRGGDLRGPSTALRSAQDDRVWAG